MLAVKLRNLRVVQAEGGKRTLEDASKTEGRNETHLCYWEN